MKRLFVGTLLAAALVAPLDAARAATTEREGEVDFGNLPLPGGGGECVEVRIKSNLIAMAARLVERQEPDIAQLLRGLKGVHVSVVSLDEKNREEVKSRIAKVRSELDDQGWEGVVTARQKQDDIRVFLKTRGDEAVEGVVVTVIEGDKQAVLVNIIGDLRPDKIAEIGERLNIQPLKEIGAKLEMH